MILLEGIHNGSCPVESGLFYVLVHIFETMVCDKLADFVHKKFATVGVIWLLCSFIVESVFSVLTGIDGEISDINCFVPKESLQVYKRQVDNACLLRYKQYLEPVLPLRWLFTISTVWYAIITIFYVAVVHRRVERIESDYASQIAQSDMLNYGENNEKLVIFSYFCHHLLCSVYGFILTGLQYPFFHPNGFNQNFACTLPPKLWSSIMDGHNISYWHLTSTSIHCESASAGPYEIINICFSVVNIFLAVVLLLDLMYVSARLKQHYRIGISLDLILVVVLFLGKHLSPSRTEDPGDDPTDTDDPFYTPCGSFSGNV